MIILLFLFCFFIGLPCLGLYLIRRAFRRNVRIRAEANAEAMARRFGLAPVNRGGHCLPNARQTPPPLPQYSSHFRGA